MKFCTGCGASLAQRCPHCAAENPPTARFCGQCATALAPGTAPDSIQPADRKPSAGSGTPTDAAAAARTPDAERRQLTILFCDMVGSVALAAQLDPEDLRQVMQAYFEACAETITRFGGYVAQYHGDGLVAYFGYPHAQENAAERAVRAGYALTEAVRSLTPRKDVSLHARVGIATGVVVVGDLLGEGAARQEAVIGDTPSLAARLQQVAQPDTVVIADSTRRLLRPFVELVDLGPQQLKGMGDRVRAWRVVSVHDAESRFESVHAEQLGRPVGRDAEVALLLARWRSVHAAEGQVAEGQVVLLSGEPGIGKSRICATLRRNIADEPHAVVRLQCSPFHVNSALHPVIVSLESVAGIVAGESADKKLERLEAFLAEFNMTASAPLFAALLSIPAGNRYPPLALSAQEMKQRTLNALVDWILALARRKPVLCILEDVHWIDPTTLQLIGLCIGRLQTAPIMLLVTCRPEFQVPWLGHGHVTVLVLNRLGRQESAAMVDNLGRGKSLPPELIDHIVAKSDGVPLFIEELTKTILESGLLREEPDRYVLTGPLTALAIPTTLQDSLVARLDRLAPIKEVAQTGAAIGREFSYQLLGAIMLIPDRALEAALAQLVRADLLHQRGHPPQATYTFKHALIQDAAYSSLLRSKRQQLHGRIADVLQAQFRDIVETQPGLIAHHLARAERTEAAIHYLREAGARDVQRSAMTEAIGHLQQALELSRSLQETPERTGLQFDLEFTLGQALMAGRGYAAAETKEAWLRARSLMDETTNPAERFAVLYGLWACYYVRSEVTMLQTLASEMLDEAERQQDALPLCVANRVMGTTLVTIGDFAASRRFLETALELYDPAKHARFMHAYGQDIRATAMNYLCLALWHLGFIDQALRLAADAVAYAKALAHPLTLTHTMCHVRGMLDLCRRCPEETQSNAEFIVAISTKHGLLLSAALGRIFGAWATICQSETGTGLEQLRSAIDAARRTGLQFWLPTFLAVEAEGHAKAGQRDVALELIEQAITLANDTGEKWALAEVMRIKGTLLLSVSREAEHRAETCFLESIALAQRQQARCWQLRAAMDLASLWERHGRVSEARDLLQSIYDQFSEGFDSADLVRARTLLQTFALKSA
jgi:class 3 adenylate cyclase/predicted ATPase